MIAPASQALIEHEPTQAPAPVVPASESAAIFQIIERAARDPNVDITKMERLMEMHERMQGARAKAAYAAALAQMQPDLPVVAEHGRGHNEVSYALWEDISEAIRPALHRHGFALSFRTGRDGDKIVVTAVLSHSEGHSEETTMLLPIDTSGNKNAVQAVGSSTSYGKRYTACALLNITSRNEDDDGKATGKAVDPTPAPTRSSASLKRTGPDGHDAWSRLMFQLSVDLGDCKSLVSLAKLRADYREKARNERWPRAWLDALANEFDKLEDGFKNTEDTFPGDLP